MIRLQFLWWFVCLSFCFFYIHGVWEVHCAHGSLHYTIYTLVLQDAHVVWSIQSTSVIHFTVSQILLHSSLLFSPWYNPNGWLGVNHKVTYSLLLLLFFLLLQDARVVQSIQCISGGSFHCQSSFAYHFNIDTPPLPPCIIMLFVLIAVMLGFSFIQIH